MTNEEMLIDLIKLAVENGFDISNEWESLSSNVIVPSGVSSFLRWVTENGEQYSTLIDTYGLETLLFDHDFARALWGEQGFGGEFTGKYSNPVINKGGGAQRGWRYYLQQLAITPEQDRIEYAYENRVK
jgi:hypothetical protein